MSALLTATLAHPYLVGLLEDTVSIVTGLCSFALGNDDLVTDFGQLYYSCAVDWKFRPLGDHSTSASVAQADLWEIGSDELVIDAFCWLLLLQGKHLLMLMQFTAMLKLAGCGLYSLARICCCVSHLNIQHLWLVCSFLLGCVLHPLLF